MNFEKIKSINPWCGGPVVVIAAIAGYNYFNGPIAPIISAQEPASVSVEFKDKIEDCNPNDIVFLPPVIEKNPSQNGTVYILRSDAVTRNKLVLVKNPQDPYSSKNLEAINTTRTEIVSVKANNQNDTLQATGSTVLTQTVYKKISKLPWDNDPSKPNAKAEIKVIVCPGLVNSSKALNKDNKLDSTKIILPDLTPEPGRAFSNVSLSLQMDKNGDKTSPGPTSTFDLHYPINLSDRPENKRQPIEGKILEPFNLQFPDVQDNKGGNTISLKPTITLPKAP